MRVKSKNPWGQTLEVQRRDLFILDMTEAISALGFSTIFGAADRRLDTISLLKEHQFYAMSVDFPEMAVTAEVIRKDSRPYNFPSWDSPLAAITVSFIHNVSPTKVSDIRRSEIYRILDVWRARVRAGRGAMSTEDEVQLDTNFRAPRFRFDITVRMCCGYALVTPSGDPVYVAGIGDEPDLTDQNRVIATGMPFDSDQVVDSAGPGLEVSSVYIIKNAWLGGFRLDSVAYDTPGVHKILATLYGEDIVQF